MALFSVINQELQDKCFGFLEATNFFPFCIYFVGRHKCMFFILHLLANKNIDLLKGVFDELEIDVRIALEAVLLNHGADPQKVIAKTSSLKRLAFTDACYATMQFAASLSAEQPGRYDFHHVGIISEGKIDEGQEIYKIDYRVKTALS